MRAESRQGLLALHFAKIISLGLFRCFGCQQIDILTRVWQENPFLLVLLSRGSPIRTKSHRQAIGEVAKEIGN